MSKWWNKIQAAVDSVVLDVLSVQTALVPEVLIELLIDVICDRFPTGIHMHIHTHMSTNSRRSELS